MRSNSRTQVAIATRNKRPFPDVSTTGRYGMIVISSPLRHNRETVSLRPLDNGRQSGEYRRSFVRRNHLARCFAFQRADIRTADQPISRSRADGFDLRFAYKRSGDRFPFWGGGLGTARPTIAGRLSYLGTRRFHRNRPTDWGCGGLGTARTPPSGPFGLAGAGGIPTERRYLNTSEPFSNSGVGTQNKTKIQKRPVVAGLENGFFLRIARIRRPTGRFAKRSR